MDIWIIVVGLAFSFCALQHHSNSFHHIYKTFCKRDVRHLLHECHCIESEFLKFNLQIISDFTFTILGRPTRIHWFSSSSGMINSVLCILVDIMSFGMPWWSRKSLRIHFINASAVNISGHKFSFWKYLLAHCGFHRSHQESPMAFGFHIWGWIYNSCSMFQ